MKRTSFCLLTSMGVWALGSSCLPFISGTLISPARAQTPGAAVVAQPSPQKYQEAMQQGRKLRQEMVGAWSQYKSVQAIEAFKQALSFSPSPAQSAEALVEGGEVIFSMALFPQAQQAFAEALRSNPSPEYKGRALIGLANSEYRAAELAKTLSQNAARLKAIFDQALKVPNLSDGELKDIWESLASIALAENKPLDAAREYLKILGKPSLEHFWSFTARDAIGQLQKVTDLSPAAQTDAVALTDGIYRVYLPIMDKPGAKHLPAIRVEYANLLDKFGQAARAESLRDEIAKDAAADESVRADAIEQIAKSQASGQKYDAALLTLDRLPALNPSFKARHHLKRAEIFLAQNKLNDAASEYAKTALADAQPDEKVLAYWGMADVAGKQAEVLQANKAPEADITKKREMQLRSLRIAQMQPNANIKLRHEAMLKLAKWETDQGNAAEAKKWEDKAATLFKSGGK